MVTKGSAASARRLARRSFQNYARYLVDFLRFPLLTPEQIDQMVTGGTEFDALDRSVRAGNGVIIACMHFGVWDLGAAAAVRRGYSVNAVIESFSDPRLDAAVTKSRELQGIKLIRMERAGPSLIRVLRRGELLALLVDRPVDEGGVTIPFFGQSVTIPAGPAKLALAGGALVMPIAFARVSKNSRCVRALAVEPFSPPNTGDRDADVVETMRLILKAQEGFIRAYPDQWYMFRQMWAATDG